MMLSLLYNTRLRAYLLKPKIIQKTPQNKTQTTKKQTLNPYKPPTHQNHSKQQQTTPNPKIMHFFEKNFLKIFPKIPNKSPISKPNSINNFTQHQ